MRTNCKHKFINDLNLAYVEWEVQTLFIGTFNPSCSISNSAEWFYGRTENNMFWNTLGYIYENNPLLGESRSPTLWVQFCERNNLAVSDIISEIKNVDLDNGDDYKNLCKGFSDKKLELYINNKQHISSNLVSVIEENPYLKKIKNIYFTRKGINHPWNILFDPIINICRQRDISYSPLITPGGYNYFQFNSDFPRTPKNLAQLWINNNGFRK